RARFYSTSTGRFISEDPIGLAGADVNLYRYASNNVANAIDPSGLSTVFININRFSQTQNATIGTLTANGRPIGYTLELPWRENRNEKSSIPTGTYFADIDFSSKNQSIVLMLQVPGRSGIEIHPGNSPA